jgi:hypothetical protein
MPRNFQNLVVDAMNEENLCPHHDELSAARRATIASTSVFRVFVAG